MEITTQKQAVECLLSLSAPGPGIWGTLSSFTFLQTSPITFEDMFLLAV